MDEIENRLRETSENCLTAYAAWSKSKRDAKAREAMAEAVHELRKVSARLEIELAASEREELAQRPIPIPPHRSSQKRPNDEGSLPSFITRGGNTDDDDGDDEGQPQPRAPQFGQRQGGNNNRGNNNQGSGKTVTLERRFTGGRRSGGGQSGGQGGGQAGGQQASGNANPGNEAAPSAEGSDE